jgi:hypothetical protein
MTSLLPLAPTTRHYVTPRDKRFVSRHATDPTRSCLHPTCLTEDYPCFRIEAVSLAGVF